MSLQTNTVQRHILDLYIGHIQKYDTSPQSVSEFSNQNSFEEIEFYRHFNSFDALERSIFKIFFDDAHNQLEQRKDYLMLNTKERLSRFYESIFKILSEHRYYVIYTIEKRKSNLESSKLFVHLRRRFINYRDHLNENKNKNNSNYINGSAWSHFRECIKFWINDTSLDFAKTKLLISKSVNSSFKCSESYDTENIINIVEYLAPNKSQAS